MYNFEIIATRNNTNNQNVNCNIQNRTLYIYVLERKTNERNHKSRNKTRDNIRFYVVLVSPLNIFQLVVPSSFNIFNIYIY